MSLKAIGCLAILAMALASSARASDWRLVAPLPHPRWFHMAGVGSDGRIYAYGGYVRAGGRREYGIGTHAIDVFDAQENVWNRGPAISSVRFKSLGQLRKGWIDENGVRQRAVILEERNSRSNLTHEVPAGKADPLGRPRWPERTLWVQFDTRTGSWGEPDVALTRPSTDFSDLSAWSWKTTGPAWFRYTPTLATSSEGLVYITGGSARRYRDGNARPELSAAVEVWDARTNEWRELAPMQHARMLHAAAVDRQGRLFVFGGSETDGGIACGQDESTESCDARGREMTRMANRSLASVEMYDPATNVWTERAPLPTPRQAMGADLGADGRIYVVGGAPSYMHPRPMAVVEIYDPETDTWQTGPSLTYKRRSHAVVATPEGQLYAIGGFVGPRKRTLRQRLAGDHIEADLGATVEVLDTRPAK